MKKQFRKTVSAALLFLFLPLTAAFPQTEKSELLNYYRLFREGRFAEASEMMFSSLMTEDSKLAYCSGVGIMVRSFPDISEIGRLKQMLIDLKSSSRMKDDHECMNLTDNMILGIELVQGNFINAENLKQKLGWVENYEVIGPFDYRDQAQFENIAQEFPDSQGILNGRNLSAEWFNARSSRTGELDFNNLFRKWGQDIFFARFSLHADSKDRYIMYLSKTGPLQMYVDGKEIFSDFSLQKACPGQFVTEIELEKGDHAVLLKLGGNADNEISCGVQVRDSSLRAVRTFPGSIPGGKAPEFFQSRPGMGLDFSGQNNDAYFLVNQGTILQSAAYINDDVTAATYLNSVSHDSPLYSYAQTLCALAESSPEKRDFYLRNAIASDSLNNAARYHLFSALLYSGFPNQAEDIIHEIEKTDGNSVYFHFSKASLYIEKEWFDLANDELDRLKGLVSERDLLLYESRIAGKNRNYGRLVEIYDRLNSMDKYNSDYAEKLLQYMTFISSPADVAARASIFSYIFYDRTFFNHKAAIAEMYDGNYDRATAYLSSAAGKCRYNSFTDFYFSRIYEAMQKDDIAAFYLKRAAVMNPSQNYFSEYYDFNFAKKDPFEAYREHTDIKELSKEALGFNTEPAVTLLDENIEKLLSDGSVLKSVRKVYKVIDPDNIKPLMQQSFIFTPSSDSIISVSCSVETGGEITHVKDISYQELSSPESRLYYDSTAAVLSIPEVRENSLIYFSYAVHSKADSEFRGYYSSTKYFDARYPVLRGTCSVIVPASVKLAYRTKNSPGADFRVTVSGGERIYSYRNTDIPSSIQEQKMTPWRERYPSVSFSSFSDWKKFHQWYRQLFEKQLVMTSEMKTGIDGAISGAVSEEDRMAAVYKFITDRTRYVGYEIGIGGIKPRRTDIVYQTGMGDCKDIALLLTAAMRYAGLKASFALVITADSGFTDEKFATVSNFNHAVCCVSLKEKGDIFLDGTVKQAGPKELVSSDMETVSLVLDGNTFRFVKIKNSYYFSLVEKEEDVIEILENGNALISVKTSNTNDTAIRLRMMAEGNVNVENRISRSWNSVFPGSSISDFRFDSLSVNQPVEYSYKIDVSGFSETDGDEIFVPVVPFSNGFLHAYALSAERIADIYIPESRNYENTTVFRVPENFAVIFLPEPQTVSFGKNTAAISFEKDFPEKGDVTVKYNIHFEKGTVSAPEYAKFRKFLMEMEKIETRKIVLKREAVKQ